MRKEIFVFGIISFIMSFSFNVDAEAKEDLGGTKFGILEEALNTLQASFDELSQQFDEFVLEVNQQFDEFTTRMDVLEEKVETIELEQGPPGPQGPPGKDGVSCSIEGTTVTCGEKSSNVQGPPGDPANTAELEIKVEQFNDRIELLEEDIRSISCSTFGKSADLHLCDLRNTNLSNLDLRFADLSEANLRNSLLIKTALRDADMRGVNAAFANFNSAGLENVDLTGANMRNTVLTNTNLSGAILTGADFTGANLEDALDSPPYEGCIGHSLCVE